MVGHRRFLPLLGLVIGIVGISYSISKLFLISHLTAYESSLGPGKPRAFPAKRAVSNFDTSAVRGGAESRKSERADSGSIPLVPSPAGLFPDQPSVLAEVIQLQQLAANTALALTPEQWLALGAVAVHTQNLRHRHEASIASVGRLNVHSYALDIPPYPEMGAWLKASFESSVEAALGKDVAKVTLLALSPALTAHFGGFGVSQQTLEFARPSRLDPNDYQVTRTVTFWQGSATEGRAVTRRETFLPGLEDPAGTSWGPLLQVLERSVSGG